MVSDRDIAADVGMCSLGTSPYQVSMLDMHDLDALMYTKLDILGLDNIGIINEIAKAVCPITKPFAAGSAMSLADITNTYVVINGNSGSHAINSYVAIDNVVFRKIAK